MTSVVNPIIFLIIGVGVLGIFISAILSFPEPNVNNFTPGYDAEKYGYKGPTSIIDYFGFTPNPALVGEFVNDTCYLKRYIVDGSNEYIVIDKNFTGSKYLSNGYRLRIFEGELVY